MKPMIIFGGVLLLSAAFCGAVDSVSNASFVEEVKVVRAEGAAGGPRDPLGRPVGPDGGEGVDLPERMDAERAREVREELRRRLSEGGRSPEEIRYLERLLERF